MSRFGFCAGTYSSQSPNADAEVCRNFYPETIEGQGKSGVVLYPTPGLALFCTLPDSPHRGSFTINGRMFAVAGSTLFEVFTDKSCLNRGSVGNDNRMATFAANPTQLVVCSNKTIYLMDLGTNTLTTPTLAKPNPSMVGYSDSFFVALFNGTQEIQASNAGDGSTWDALSVGEISQFPDNVVSMIVDHREIWLFGNTKTIVYADYGASPFPFLPITGAIIEQGCAAEFSPVKMDNTVFWIGADERGQGIAWRANGYIPQRVSNHAVEYKWSTYSTISDAVAFPYQDQGHTFWVINFPSGNATWVYDAAENQWHERAYLSLGVQNAHLGISHTFAFGKHLVGDRQSGKLYDMSIAYYDDAGSPIQRTRRAPHLSTEQQRLFHAQLQIDVEPGIGLNPQQATTSTSPVSIVIPDELGNSWKLTVNDDGTSNLVSSSDASNIILLRDYSVSGTAWQLMVDSTGPYLENVQYPFDVTLPTILNMATTASLQDALIYVTNGALQIQTQSVYREPQVSLKWSNDGAHTWSSEHFAGAGNVGEYKKRIIWRRLGQARDRVYEMNVSDPIPWRVIDAYLTATGFDSPVERLATQLRKGA